MNIVAKVKHQLAHVRGRKARQRAVMDFRRSLALIVDGEALEASVAMRLKELFDPTLLVVLQLDARGERYRAGFNSGLPDAGLEGLELRPQGRLARWFLVNESCLLVPRQPGVMAFLEEAERRLLERLDVQLCAPLLARNHVAGMLMLGKIPREPTRRDAELLMDLANQASLAFQNVALYRDQQERLEDLYRADRLASLGQLTASVAHEVGNPLTAIRSTVQYLQGRLDDEDPNRELVGDVLDDVDRIRQTIDAMLGMTRHRAPEAAVVDLAELVEQTVHLAAAKARRQSVTVAQKVPSPMRVEADPDLLRQVFLNLILNALQAMPEGGRIEISGAWEAAAGDGAESGDAAPEAWARLLVTDNGPGIPAPDLERVFDRFFTTRSDGTGLGLAICREIIEQQHQGTIVLESEEGAGTTVSIRLPARRRPEKRS